MSKHQEKKFRDSVGASRRELAESALEQILEIVRESDSYSPDQDDLIADIIAIAESVIGDED